MSFWAKLQCFQQPSAGGSPSQAPSIPPSMTLSEIRIDKFCQLPLVSIFTFKPPSDAASPILRTLASAVFAPAFACTFPMAWQPAVHVDSYQARVSDAAGSLRSEAPGSSFPGEERLRGFQRLGKIRRGARHALGNRVGLVRVPRQLQSPRQQQVPNISGLHRRCT